MRRKTENKVKLMNCLAARITEASWSPEEAGTETRPQGGTKQRPIRQRNKGVDYEN